MKPSYEQLEAENASLRKRIIELELKLEEVTRSLKGLLVQDSRTSHKPPSQDKKRYPKMRLKAKGESVKKKREPKTLEYKEEADHHEVLKLDETRCECGRNLAKLPSHWERVQVYDLPKLALEVWEYQRERKRCECGCLHEASLPEGVNRGVQYGSRIKGLLNYLHHYQEIPLHRCAELVNDCFGQSLSETSILNSSHKLYEILEQPEKDILTALKEVPVVYGDETGVFVTQKNHHVHVRSNEKLTHYHVDSSRGKQAHQAIGLLESYTGYIVHDCYSSYFSYKGKHVVCHSHIVRELLAVYEQTQQTWALTLAQHLLDTNKERRDHSLTKDQQADRMQTYKDLVLEGLMLNPKRARAPDDTKRGKVKQTKAHNLVHRLLIYADAATAFIRDPIVPFTNNQAERDLRMVKLKQKISGGFRTLVGAQHFCRIRGYISTLRKNHMHVLDALTHAFQHKVLLPDWI